VGTLTQIVFTISNSGNPQSVTPSPQPAIPATPLDTPLSVTHSPLAAAAWKADMRLISRSRRTATTTERGTAGQPGHHSVAGLAPGPQHPHPFPHKSDPYPQIF